MSAVMDHVSGLPRELIFGDAFVLVHGEHAASDEDGGRRRFFQLPDPHRSAVCARWEPKKQDEHGRGVKRRRFIFTSVLIMTPRRRFACPTDFAISDRSHCCAGVLNRE